MPLSIRVAMVAITILAGSSVQARPPHRQALADYFGPFLARKLNDCRTCHLPDPPGQPADNLTDGKPHNAFGARLKAVKWELRRTGKPITIAARLEAVAEEDSDGDGVSNLIELLSGHFPGDPADKPTAEEIVQAGQTLHKFRQWQKDYAWRPFERVKRPTVPVVRNGAWVRNPVDAFIAAEHERRGLKPRPEASRAILLRRVYFDLIGLPPTPEQLHAFLADPDPDAYEKVVDRLLDSPHHGERWGRHWMDIWRYSDWAGWSGGGQIRDSQPHIWRWRDWIVESLNQDRGYDRMIVEMLAGDELAPEDPGTLRATGYLVRNYKMLSREKWMQDTVNHTAQAFLGVTLGCARCHDHMYDPILQKEYYQVRAIFEPYQVRIDRLPGQPDTKKDGLARVYDANPQAPTFLFIRGDDRAPDKTPLAPGVPEVFGERLGTIEPVRLPLGAYIPEKRDFVVQEEITSSRTRLSLLRSQWKTLPFRGAQVAIVAAITPDPLTALFRLAPAEDNLEEFQLWQIQLDLAESKIQALVAARAVNQLEAAGRKSSTEWNEAAGFAARTQRAVRVLEARRALTVARLGFDPFSADSHAALAARFLAIQRKSDPRARGGRLKKIRAAEQALTRVWLDARRQVEAAYVRQATPTYPSTSTGRRLAFARWVTNPDNPLTARVAINHIWLRHFGQAIVPSVFDFGRNGLPPSHPALLDWLAAEFMARNWSMKEMHRLIVTSSTYRMVSTTDAADTTLDRDNIYLWHMPSRRMEAELVRDSIFYVSGRLDLAVGGAEIDEHQGLVVPRRSLYFRHAAEKQMEFLKIFDGPAVTECYERKESVMPQQALALINSALTLKQARLLARKLWARAGPDAEAFLTGAFEQVLSRPPSSAEKSECLAFLVQQARHYRQRPAPAAGSGVADAETPATDADLRARENLVHVLMNHNDFVSIR
jgi:Protein of unknown function (DUF1553)/Protein of unknown function (DUF1549)